MTRQNQSTLQSLPTRDQIVSVSSEIQTEHGGSGSVEVCRLCGGTSIWWQSADAQAYFQCRTCALVQMGAAHLPDQQAEKACYDLHQNDAEDLGYRKFLSRLSDPLLAALVKQYGCVPWPRLQALDFGCGPGPALARMLSESGLTTLAYDPIYAPQAELLAHTYDVITCTEVVEHFHHPKHSFTQLARLMKPQARLAIMTQWLDESVNFSRWHYRRDPTHVCFYQRETFIWLAQRFHWRWQNPAHNVVIFHAAET